MITPVLALQVPPATTVPQVMVPGVTDALPPVGVPATTKVPEIVPVGAGEPLGVPVKVLVTVIVLLVPMVVVTS